VELCRLTDKHGNGVNIIVELCRLTDKHGNGVNIIVELCWLYWNATNTSLLKYKHIISVKFKYNFFRHTANLHATCCVINNYNSNIRSRCGPGMCISSLFTRCHYLSIFHILPLTNWLGINLKIWHGRKIGNSVTISSRSLIMTGFRTLKINKNPKSPTTTKLVAGELVPGSKNINIINISEPYQQQEHVTSATGRQMWAQCWHQPSTRPAAGRRTVNHQCLRDTPSL